MGEDPSQNEVASLKGAGAYATTVVASERLLVPGCTDGGLAMGFFKEKCIFFLQLSLACFIESENPWGAVPELGGEDCLCAVDQKERCLSSGLGCCCVD